MSASYRRSILGAVIATLAGAAGAAAQPSGPGPGMGPGGGRGRGPGGGQGGGPGFGRGLTDPASYLAGLKTELGITGPQEAAWNEYAAVVTAIADQMPAARATVFDAMPTASWQERQAMMNQMTEARDNAHAAVREAAEKLLPALTPAQRAKAATILPGLMPRRGRGARP